MGLQEYCKTQRCSAATQVTMHVHLETDRLKISPLTENDAAFIYELLNTKGWIEFIGNRNIHSLDDSVQYIRRINGTPGYFYNVFSDIITGRPYGLVTFLFRPGSESPDLGFAMLPEAGGKGFAYEASLAYLHELKKKHSGKKISGITIPQNVKSIRLLEKLGFEYEGQKTEGGELLNMYGLRPVSVGDRGRVKS